MPLTKDCAEYVASFVFGCTGLALGAVGVAGAVPAAALPAVIGGTTLAGMWLAEKKKRGPESEEALKKIIARITDESREGIGQLKHEHGQKLSEASALLGEHLPQCNMSREQLARDATDRSAALFPEAATDRVMIELAGKAPDVFGQGGNMIAISLAREVIGAAFEAAIEDKAYFEKLEPHLLIEMARTAGEILAKVEGLEARLRSEFAELTGKIDGLRDGQAHMMAAIAELAARLPPTDLPDQAVMSLATRIVAENDGDEALALAELERAVEVARDMRKAGVSLANLDGFVASVVSRMAELNDVGDGDAADREYEAALAQMERDEAEESERRREAKTALIDQGVGQAYLRRDAEAVAQREADKAALTASGEDLFEALRGVQDEYYETGLRMGTRFDLLVGVALARRCAEIAEMPEEWAKAQILIGILLGELGDRGEPDVLEDSVSAFEAALTVFNMTTMPIEWAGTHVNLGNVLQTLGRRGKAGALEGSITSYRAALTVYTKTSTPRDWANAKNNLGNSLAVLGQRGAVRMLEDSVCAYQAALTVRTIEDMPIEWAATNNNLGIVFRVQGELGETLAFERSHSAFKAALKVRSKKDRPFEWAGTKNNLGRLREAQGDAGEGRAAYLAAELHYMAALEIWQGDAPAYAEIAEENLARVRQKLVELG